LTTFDGDFIDKTRARISEFMQFLEHYSFTLTGWCTGSYVFTVWRDM